jgi:hypothetical protein
MERKIKHSAALAWSTVGDRNHYRLAVFDVVTRTFVPNGGLRWAAVDASRLKREPLGPIRPAENRQEALRANIGQPARKNLFLEIFQRDLAGPVPFVKIFGFPSAANQRHFRVVLLPHEGRFAIVTNVGNRMRWTRRCARRALPVAYDEVVWS